MSNNINVNSITKNINNSQNNNVNKKDSERDLLKEFSEILGKITSAVKGNDKASNELLQVFQTVEIKRETKNIHKNNHKQEHYNENDIVRIENKIDSPEVDSKANTYRNEYTEYPADSLIEREQVEFSQDDEVEINRVEEQLVEEDLETEEELLEQEITEEILEEVVVQQEISEIASDNPVSIKTNNETELTNEKLVAVEVDIDQLKSDEPKESEVILSNQLKSSEAKNLEIQTEESDQKLKEAKEVNLEKNTLASEGAVNENLSESIETETLKTKVIAELDKKLVDKESPKTDSKELVNSDTFEESELLSNQQLIRNIAKQTVLENAQINVSGKVQENAMKTIINQAKDVLTKQFDFKFSNNTTSTQVNIQNVQANVGSKGGEVLTKDSKPLALPRTYANRTISKVEEVIKELSKSKDGKTISVRLDPPSLGSVKVDVSYKDGALTARVMAESNQVGQFLKDKAIDLQQLLRKSGINVEEVNVWFGSQSEFSDSSESKSFDDFENNFNERNFQSNDLAIEGEVVPEVQKDNEILDHWVA